MALGGGVFTTTNEILPGSYINIVSKARNTSLLGERGVVAIVLPLDWGNDGVIKLTSNQFYTESLRILGYSSDANNENMRVLREIFRNASEVVIYNSNPNSTKASVTASNGVTAAVGGTRGNDLAVTFTTNSVDSTKMDVVTKLGTTVVSAQTIVAASEKPASNAWVTFPSSFTVPESGTTYSFTGGAAGSAVDVETALEALSQEDFNVLCAYTSSEQGNYITFTKTQRDVIGKKFQCVVYNTPSANHEGIISVSNAVSETPTHALVAWVAGAEAGCAVNKAITNKIYDGELTVTCNETQSELATALESGKLIFHKVAGDVRVLEDINTYTDNTVEKNGEFGYNQTIRVIDQIANDISTLFNTKYIGSIANNAAGRVSLWNDIVKHHKELETIEAIENFDSAEVVVSPHPTDKRAVIVNDAVVVVNCMTKMYMTLYIS